ATLEAYVRIEQDRAEVVVERRTPEGWRAERFSGIGAVVGLPTLEIELPLAELYERIKFPG
ncbi:MAG: Uma2 family endonuclease, partial [Chthoniobacteraceae bacterium]